jgi:hypothetical protein
MFDELVVQLLENVNPVKDLRLQQQVVNGVSVPDGWDIVLAVDGGYDKDTAQEILETVWLPLIQKLVVGVNDD